MMRWETTVVRHLSSRLVQAQELPLWRYFLFVGGGLLALLVLMNAVLPPARESRASGPNFPVIRIHSKMRGPPAVVIDTSQRMIAPVIAAQDDSPAAPAPLPIMPASGVRESFAQYVLPSNRQADASEPKKPARRPLPKRKVLLAHVKHPAISDRSVSELGF